MTQKKELLTNYHEFEKLEKVALGDGRSAKALGVGDVHLSEHVDQSELSQESCGTSSTLCA